MDKPHRLPPLGAPSTRAPPSSEPPYAPLTFFDSQSPQPQPISQRQQQQHQSPLPHAQMPPQSRPPPATSTPLFPPLSTPTQRSSHPSPPLPVSAEPAISKPKKLHREVEQKRRMRMAEQIAELRQCVSDPNSGKTDKVSILQDAVAFVKAAKRTIHSLQYKLQAAESECGRLFAILTELQPNLRQQSHQSAAPVAARAHLHPVPSASPIVASTRSHAPTSHAPQLSSNAPVRASPFNFESVLPHTPLREAAAAAAADTRSITPTSELVHSPTIAQQGASWNAFASSAQPFSHAAVRAPSHPSAAHFSHALHRTHSQPLHSSLPHLRSAQHQPQHQSFVGAHSGAPYASTPNSLSRSEPTSRLGQHAQLRHQSHLKRTEALHQHAATSAPRAAQGRQSAGLAHAGDQATMSTHETQRHLQ